MFWVVLPLLQEYANGEEPVITVRLTLPSLFPLQVTGTALTEILSSIPVSHTVAEAVFTQLYASVTVTV